MNDDVYKTFSPRFEEEVENEAKRIAKKLKEEPLLIGVLLAKLIEERENTNRLLKTLIARLEAIEKKLEGEGPEEMILSETDEAIVQFVKESGKATAEDVQKRFNYKGKNAASQRLNKLYESGLLRKKQAGKKVYYFI
jgi:predicted HTH transcriptional regulator